jgi:DeoR family fructose operon transcriptional repressor
MIAEERLGLIVSAVNERGTVSVPELMDMLDASESTIRRDLLKLDSQGRLNKVHGGATRIRNEYVVSDQSLAGRQTLHMEEKRAIAAYAATLISQDDFVFIDGGTTTECLVDAITETRATYLTNSLPHAQRLLAKGCRTLLPGGEVKPTTEVLVGAETVNTIRRYHFTIGFWGTNGAGLETGYTTPEFSEAAVKQISLEHTVRPYILADSSKFSKISLITFAEFNDASVITDRLPKGEGAYRSAGNVVEVEEQ